MNTSIDLNELDKEDLLSGLDRGKRRSIESLMMDADVQFIVVLESKDRKRRNLLTVGPKLEYTNLEAIAGLKIDGLQPRAYLDNRKSVTRSPFFTSKTTHENRRLELLVDQLQAENRELKTSHSVAVSRLTALELREEETSRLLVENKQTRLDLDVRETDLHKMEEDLMDHMNQLVQKQTEMEQWEENMFARERAFAEKQEKTTDKSKRNHVS